ncbi:MAG: type II toxin-antitoxin system VapC family toxin [Acidobacteriia bacterium]|nr:type II toxin-antitoxin system VapC family toxin [Terriglobia bacterium]
MNYWDTSALLKLYVPEEDSGAFLDLIAASDEPIATSAIATAEVLCAVNRKERAGDLKRGGAAAAFRRFVADCDQGRIVPIPYGTQVLEVAQAVMRVALHRSRPLFLRSLDLIHVASALTIHAGSVVATDARLREVAALVKLRLLP